jgi:hypothetical protein
MTGPDVPRHHGQLRSTQRITWRKSAHQPAGTAAPRADPDHHRGDQAGPAPVGLALSGPGRRARHGGCRVGPAHCAGGTRPASAVRGRSGDRWGAAGRRRGQPQATQQRGRVLHAVWCLPDPGVLEQDSAASSQRGGNRQANTALYRIVVVRLRWHQPTRDYLARRTREGLSKREIIRCLKRYVAREVFAALQAPTVLAATA